MDIQRDYVIENIYTYTRRPEYVKSNKVYNFECPICKEGKSRGKKKRGYYIPETNRIYCHNCGWNSIPVAWIHKVSGKPFADIRRENDNFFSSAETIINPIYTVSEDAVSPSLPNDSINLFNDTQTKFYKHNEKISNALKYIQSRRIDTAKSRPKAIYYSLTDKLYKDTICFPFYDADNKIIFFQVREMDPTKAPKYRSDTKQKAVFNLNQVSSKIPYIFIFEGPIDSMFIKNGVAIAGTAMTNFQANQLEMFPLHDKIWCFDNQHRCETSKKLTLQALKRGEKVFIWPEKFSQFKDLNELCCHYNLDEIGYKFIVENTITSLIEAVARGIKLARF